MNQKAAITATTANCKKYVVFVPKAGMYGHDGAGLGCRPLSGDALSMEEGLVTDGDFFTRETWRRGKKNRLRKRTKPLRGARRLLLRFSKRPSKPNSSPAGPVAAFAARPNATDVPVDDWL